MYFQSVRGHLQLIQLPTEMSGDILRTETDNSSCVSIELQVVV